MYDDIITNFTIIPRGLITKYWSSEEGDFFGRGDGGLWGRRTTQLRRHVGRAFDELQRASTALPPTGRHVKHAKRTGLMFAVDDSWGAPTASTPQESVPPEVDADLEALLQQVALHNTPQPSAPLLLRAPRRVVRRAPG